MNHLLLEASDLRPDGLAELSGRRLQHAREVLRATAGDSLKVGLLRGGVGQADVLELTERSLLLRPRFDQGPPPRPGLDLLLAIPRPKALKKVLPAVASLGIDRLVLVNAARVEKSYFDSKVLEGAFLQELLVQGLEQARDTQPPELFVRERFRPFVEDELDAVFGKEGRRLVAHPAAASSSPSSASGRTLLAIGPEGGWVEFELALLRASGFRDFSAGPRPLRVEVAVPYLLGLLSLSLGG